MKVIGNIPGGVIVTMSDGEVAHAAGYVWPSDLPGFTRQGPSFRPGLQIDVTAAWSYMWSLRQHEKECRSSARFLRTMAAMIEASLPTTVIPPDPAPKDDKAA